MAIKTMQTTLNGQTYNLTLNTSTGKYEATITAPSTSSYKQSGHYYPMTVTATDDAGNTTTVNTSTATIGESLKLKVKETTPPTIIVTSPTANQTLTNNKPTIAFTVTDSDSGVNSDTINVTIDGTKYTSGINKTVITNGYSCTFVPGTALTDGSHTVTVAATDNDGNTKTTTAVTFKIDTVPPALSVTSPTDGLVTNQPTVTVTGTTNDATSSPVTLTINGEAVTVTSNGTFSHVVTLTNGTNTITVVAADAAGKSTTVTRTVTYNTSAPVISAVTITPNPVNTGNVFTISVTATDE